MSSHLALSYTLCQSAAMHPDETRDEFLTVAEVAKLLKVSRMTVVRLADEGHLSAFRFPSGRRRFSREAVDHFIRSRTQTSGDAA